MSTAIEEFGFRLSLGIQEVDEHLTEQEIETLEAIAVRYIGRRTIALILEDEERKIS